MFTTGRGLVVLLLVGALLAGSGTATASVGEYALKAEFVVRLTRFVTWPVEGGTERSPIVVGLLGDDPEMVEFARQISESGQRAGIRVKRLEAVSEVDQCDLVFIPPSEEHRLRRVLARTAGRPILTVADSPGFAERGVMINFVVVDNRVAIEINPDRARAGGLELSARLLKLGRIVQAEARP